MAWWRCFRLQSPSTQGLLVTLVLLGAFAGAPMLIAPLQSIAVAAVPATAVQLIDPRARVEAFDDFYQEVRSLGTQFQEEVIPLRAFSPLTLKQHEPSELATYVKLSHMGLRSILEDAKVKLLIETLPEDVERLQALFEQGVAPLIRVILVHIPSELSVEDRVDEWTQFFGELRQLVRHYGGNAEIWVQRTDWALSNAERTREHLLLLHSGADKVYVSSILGGTLRPTRISLLTLVTEMTMTNQLEGHTYLGHLELGDGIWALVFARDGVPLLVTWSVNGSWTLELTGFTESVEVVNLYGQARAAMVQHDRLRVALSPEPIYIRGLDGGLVARAFLESAIDRLGAIIASATHPGVSEDSMAELLALTNAVATDIWHTHDYGAHETFRSLRTETDGGRMGWQAPNVIASFETGRPPQPDREATLERWEQVMARLFATAYVKVATLPEVRAWRWGELDALPLLVELIAAFGNPWGGDEALGYVAGTGILVHDAAAFLHETTRAEPYPSTSEPTHLQGDRFEANWLLDRALHWLQRAEQSDNEAAATAWALIARETAVLAVERSLTETPLADHLLLAAPFIELEHRIGGYLGDPADRLTDDTPFHPLDVPLFGVFVREVVAESQMEWHLQVEVPAEWLWQAGSRAGRLDSGDVAPVIVPAEGQPYVFADSLGLVPLHLRLLVPSDTPIGRYPVRISFIDPKRGMDAITLYVTIR